MSESLSRVHQNHFTEWARFRPEVFVLAADLTSSCEADLFQKTFPHRFINFGVAEQNMLSFSGGMAREGLVPFIHTFAVFIYRRAYDQIAMSVAYPNLPVKMVGFLPGLTTPGGASHQAIEDIAIMRALPNMTILEAGDATDIESIPDIAMSVPGPVYIRMLRGDVKRLFPKNKKMQFNTPRILSQGKDLALITSGICTEDGLIAGNFLKKAGVSLTHLHISTLKPCGGLSLIGAIAGSAKGVITVENHSTIGGLGSIISELITVNTLNKRHISLGIQDTFSHGASLSYLKKEHNLNATSIILAAQKLLGEKFTFREEDLTLPDGDSHISEKYTYSKAEDL